MGYVNAHPHSPVPSPRSGTRRAGARRPDSRRAGSRRGAVARFAARHRVALAAAVVVAVVEIVLGNLPFWSTLSAVRPDGAVTVVGDGLTAVGDGSLVVSDPTAAVIEVDDVDAPVEVVRYEPGDAADPADGTDDAADSETGSGTDDELEPLEPTLDVRLDVRDADGVWHTGRADGMNRWADASLYLRNRAYDGEADAVRLWIQEPAGTRFAFSSLGVNDTPPFSVDPLRVLAFAAVAVFVVCLRPGSRLYRIRLDPSDRRQRLAFAATALPLVAAVAWSIISSTWQGTQTFHEPFSYTYDFNQYAQAADSLIHGRPWLDLPVPDELKALDDPYSVSARERLLERDVQPIFWDHVFYDGHWYSYFGVVPVVLLFVPYQLVTSLWVPGGAQLPAQVAVALFVAGFAMAGMLLVIRLLRRFFPRVSLGMTVLALIAFLCGSNVWALWLRPSFYEIASASALMFAALGLWLWLGARRMRVGSGPDARDRAWTVDDAPDSPGGDPYAVPGCRLSLPRVALGSLSMALTLGCRATLVLAAVLFLPVFADEIRSGRLLAPLGSLLPRRVRFGGGRIGPWRALAADAAAVVPAIAVFAPLLAYNRWRFGSWLDFGNDYQITVVDLTRYREPLESLPQVLRHYLVTPPRLTGSFPWLAVPYTPIDPWQYHGPIVCGYLWFAPVCLLLVALPWMRRALRRHRSAAMVASTLALAVVELLVVAYKGGLEWRYVCDFGWLPMIAVALAMAVVDGRRRTALEHGDDAVARRMRLAVALVVALVFVSLMMNVAATFMTGRAGAMIGTDARSYYAVRSWFAWLW